MVFFIISSVILLSLLFLLYYVHKNDWSVPLVGALRRNYFHSKYRLGLLYNKNAWILYINLLKFKIKLISLCITMFETSTKSFDVLKEDLYTSFLKKIKYKRLNKKEEEDLKWVQEIMNGIQTGEKMNLSKVELLYEQLFKIHKLQKEKVRKYSLYGILLLIFANVFTTIAIAILFPGIYNSKADTSLQISFNTLEDWKTVDEYKEVDFYSVPGELQLPYFSTVVTHAKASDYEGAELDHIDIVSNPRAIQLSKYASLNAFYLSGVLTSKIIDSGAQAKWERISYESEIPAGTVVIFETRTKKEFLDDSKEDKNHGWSAWEKVDKFKITSPEGRYIQYRIHLITDSDDYTPVVKSISLLKGDRYSEAGEYSSRIIDSGVDIVDWVTLFAKQELKENTSIEIYTRTGSTDVIDTTWSEWEEVTSEGVIVSPDYKFLQFKIILKTNDDFKTPIIKALEINYFNNTQI